MYFTDISLEPKLLESYAQSSTALRLAEDWAEIDRYWTRAGYRVKEAKDNPSSEQKILPQQPVNGEEGSIDVDLIDVADSR